MPSRRCASEWDPPPSKRHTPLEAHKKAFCGAEWGLPPLFLRNATLKHSKLCRCVNRSALALCQWRRSFSSYIQSANQDVVWWRTDCCCAVSRDWSVVPTLRKGLRRLAKHAIGTAKMARMPARSRNFGLTWWNYWPGRILSSCVAKQFSSCEAKKNVNFRDPVHGKSMWRIKTGKLPFASRLVCVDVVVSKSHKSGPFK